MSREILFRGKRTDNGEWAEGLPGYDINGHITEIEVFKGFGICYALEIDPETICEYTGMTDKNGTKIFEGDIIKATYGNGEYEIGEIYFKDGECCTRGDMQDHLNYLNWLSNLTDYKFEVIGNIFDNPELIDSGGKPE